MAGVFYFPLLGTPTAPGNQLSFFESGTDVPLDVWTDPDLSLPWSQPIIFNAAGNPDGPIYVSSTPDMKVVYEDADGVAIPGYPVDFVTPSTIPGVMTTSITVLTNAQIKALPTTGITLVAAPGAGARIKVFGISFDAVTTAGAYTNINTTYSALQANIGSAPAAYGIINDSTATPALTTLTDFLGAAAVKSYELGAPPVQVSSAASGAGYAQSADILTTSVLEATALTLNIDNNGSGALTGGNAANTLTVTVYYALQTV